ncbi:hypothetical protein EWM64_g6100 [Hericium alpestre]|uniref:Uncharacterized protein n=1 Tax=Hericium alpestre TaxID=135208 RepID=A0A4Y9ZVK2_9AGAM|nr:hypothetical protein EWM64_g6100 [Hericium alpestre]
MSDKTSSRPSADHPPPSPKNPPPKRARMQAQAGTGFNDPWINMRGATQQAQNNPSTTPREARERSISPLVVRRPVAPAAAPTTNPSQATPPISNKAMIDRFLKIERALRDLDNEHKYDTNGLQLEVNKLRDYVVELQEWTQRTSESIHNLENELLELKELILVQHVGIGREGGGKGEGEGEGESEGPNLETAVTPMRRSKKRDNRFARTIRNSLKALMKRVGSQRLPDPLVIDDKVEYWLVQGKLRILCANWDQDWDDNKLKQEIMH